MHIDITLFGLTIPAYGCMIASGVIMANIFAMFVLKRTKQDLNDFIILEAFWELFWEQKDCIWRFPADRYSGVA